MLFYLLWPNIRADANIGNTDFYAPYNGYFHPVGLFDSFNPKAIIDLNTNTGESKNVLFSTSARLNLTDNLVVNTMFSRQSSDLLNAEYYSVYDAYRGGAGSSKTGLASRNTFNSRSTLFESYATFSNTINKLDYIFTSGYSFQQDNSEFFHSRQVVS